MVLDREEFILGSNGKKYYLCSHCNLDIITFSDQWCPCCGAGIEWITRSGETAHANTNS